MMAGAALAAELIARLHRIGELSGVHELAPVQASPPFATVETGPEADWSHKTGKGRELRVAIIVRDKGERPDRIRRLIDQVQTEIEQIGPDVGSWRLATLVFLRSRTIREAGGWAATIEYRARLLEAPS